MKLRRGPAQARHIRFPPWTDDSAQKLLAGIGELQLAIALKIPLDNSQISTLGKYIHNLQGSTNTIEAFWSLAKRGIDGVHHSVGRKYLQSYFNAYAFRWNHRDAADPMFFEILDQIPASSEPEKQGE